MKQCGTIAAYTRHLRAKETPCTQCKEARAAYNREQRAANPRQMQEYDRARYAKKLEKSREVGRQASQRRREMKTANGQEKYTNTQVLEKYGTNCYLCGQPIDLTTSRKAGHEGWEQGLHIDHLLAIALGGPDTLENVRPAHGECNLHKHSSPRQLTT
jgi:5-methylcytosine-specific restriction endonuclease McrA